MDELYNTLKRKNNVILKSLNTDYSIVIIPLVRKLRKYGSVTSATENTINVLLSDIKESMDNGVKYSTYSFGKDLYNDTIKDITPRSKVHTKYSFKEILIIGIFLIGLFGFAVVQIILTLPVKFKTIDKVWYSGSNLVFSEVEYAEEYTVYFYSGDVLLKELTVEDNEEASVISINLNNIEELNNPGTYTIYIKVNSNDIYSASKLSEGFEYIKE